MAGHAEHNPAEITAWGAPRVLVVEDNGLIAFKIVQILRRGGCTVVGPAATLAAAIDLAEREAGTLDAALLDIDLRGDPAYPLAEVLRARAVPFLFLTGYEQLAIPEAWRGVPRIEKPFEAAALLRGLVYLLSSAPPLSDTPTSSPALLSELDYRLLSAIRTSRDLLMERSILKEMKRDTALKPR